MYTNCHSYFSLRYGTFSEKDLLELAKKNEIYYLALTDINNTSAVLSFLQLSHTYKVWPIIGVDFRNNIKQEYVILAKSNLGYYSINNFLSDHLNKKKEFPMTPPLLEDTYVIYPFEKILEMEKKDLRDHEFIGISVKNLNRLPFSFVKDFHNKLVIQQTVTFRNRTDFNAHKLLRCIDMNILGDKLSEQDCGSYHDRVYTKRELLDIYAQYPYIIENTKRICQHCKVDFFFGDEKVNQNQDVYLKNAEEDFNYLKELTFKALPTRYQKTNPQIMDRLNKELSAIRQMNFVSYFLINYDIVTYAKSKNYPYIGRGSGANSLVAYILGITNVDPIELDLYFERFINVYRSSPPDFDLDFSWKDRDDITAYIFQKFPNVALMGTYVTFQYRAVVRELSKVFGLPKAEVDEFLMDQRSSNSNDHYFKLIEKYGRLIHGFPNHISVHSGGIIITSRPIHYFCSTFLPPKGFPTVSIDMNIAEDIGIHKFDILAQRGLSKIKDTLEIIGYNKPNAKLENIEQPSKFFKDDNINRLLKTGDCMGVFYVESPAMRALMTKLGTDSYLNLVAASSIIRPGVSNGGMKNEFILRHKYPTRRKEGHPILMEILDETYGVMVYQEDVLKVAHRFAGLTLAEADILRRAMRGKTRFKGEFEEIEERFKNNCLKKGIDLKTTEDVWQQIRAFAGYAFAKGHSASYAVESYQSLYLKCYFPLEYMTAVLNNGGGFYNLETYIREISLKGGTVEPPCINISDHPNSIINSSIYLGFGMIKDLEIRAISRILTERQLNGPFIDFDDFYQRVSISKEQLALLIRADCFRFTGIDKHQIMWTSILKESNGVRSTSNPELFKTKQINYVIPDIKTNSIIEAYDQMELFGFPLSSRFALLEIPPKEYLLAKDLPAYLNKKVVIYGQLITAKGTPTQDKRLMFFGTFFDVEGTIFDTVHFPNISEKYSIRSQGVYKIIGKVSVDMDFYSIEVQEIYFQSIIKDPRSPSPQNSNKNIIP